MAVYMITYDIEVEDSFEYEDLWKEIKDLAGDGKWIRPLESVWFVDTITLSANDIFNHLKAHLTLKEKNGDSIIIRRCIPDGQGHYLKADINWMVSKDRTWDTPAYP